MRTDIANNSLAIQAQTVQKFFIFLPWNKQCPIDTILDHFDFIFHNATSHQRTLKRICHHNDFAGRAVTSHLLPFKIADNPTIPHDIHRLDTFRPQITHFHNPRLAFPPSQCPPGKYRKKLRRCGHNHICFDKQPGNERRDGITYIIQRPFGNPLIRHNVAPHPDNFYTLHHLFLVQCIPIARIYHALGKIRDTCYHRNVCARLHPCLAMVKSP